MRRIILIFVNTIYLLCAGLWVGGTVGVGALAAPAAFRDLEGLRQGTVPMAGIVMGHAFRRTNTFSVTLLGVMLAVAVFEVFYRKRTNTKRLLAVRMVVTLAGLLVTLYLSNVMMPRMELQRSLSQMDAFDAMHKSYRGVANLQVLIGVALIALTNAVNISPRRSGGHPRGRTE